MKASDAEGILVYRRCGGCMRFFSRLTALALHHQDRLIEHAIARASGIARASRGKL